MGRNIQAITVEDPDGAAWHAVAAGRWAEAVRVKPEDPLAAFDPLPLPDFRASLPVHVTREVFGRFLEDRATRVVHDVYQATPECAVDTIRDGTFFHFWVEVVADTSVADDQPCPHCMAPSVPTPSRGLNPPPRALGRG